MKLTESWLREHLDTDASLDVIAQTLTKNGLEIEEIVNRGEGLKPFLIVEILSSERHPDADKLSVCQVDTGSETLQVVCGAPNAKPGKFIYAPIGAVIPTNGMVIKKAAIRGVESSGMLCSAGELGLGEESDGILRLPDDAPVGTPYVDYANLDDPMLDIAITPNRGDCLGVYGVARDLAASSLGTLKTFDVPSLKESFPNTISIKISDTESCTQFAGCIIRGVKNGPSPTWLKSRLESIGEGSISTIVDITNYIMITYGRPLHTYDLSKLDGGIEVRRAKEGETFTALDEKEYRLSENIPVIADDKKVLGVAGVIGGMESGTWDETTDIFLESAWFEPEAITKAGRELHIDSGARYRFERHVDPAFVKEGLLLAAKLIIECCGGEMSEITHEVARKAESRRLSVAEGRFASLIGYEMAKEQMDAHLTRLGFVCARENGFLHADVPSWRSDIRVPDQIVEEAARMEGYDALPAESLVQSVHDTLGRLTLEQRRKSMVRRHLASHGMMEVVSWSFISEEQADHFGASATLKIQNPISQDLSVMRPSQIASMLPMIARNLARNYNDLAIFEVGPHFYGQGESDQEHVVTGLATGYAVPRQALGEARKYDAYDAKGWLMPLLAMCGLSENSLRYSTKETPAWYHPGQSTTLLLGKNPVAHVGTLHPSTCALYGIKESCVAFECFIDRMPLPRKKQVYRGTLKASEYQSVERDFAFVTLKDQPVDSILKAILGADKQLVQNVSLFDVYEGEHVEAGKKSIALSVTLQADDRTLTDNEIQSVSQKIIDQVAKHCNATLRS